MALGAKGATRKSQETMQQAESQGPKVGVFAIFLTFSRVTLSSFGSPLFWARRALVERQHWLTEREFVDLLALGQLLPGANVLNLAALVGYRFAGWAGALAACAGFMGWPFLIVIAMGALHQRYGQWRLWLFGVLAFAGVGVLHWPLLVVGGALAPCAIVAAWKDKD